MRARSLLAGVGLVAAATQLAGCGTCRPREPRVEPRVEGAIGGGSGGFWHGLSIGLDVSNLFCRAPEEETKPRPGPGSPPVADPPPSDAEEVR